jgi:hypothetical protein
LPGGASYGRRAANSLVSSFGRIAIWADRRPQDEQHV